MRFNYSLDMLGPILYTVYIMTNQEIELLHDLRDINTLNKAEALAQLQVYRKYKIWAGRYYALNQRVQKLAVAQWVKEDVFGHTFTGNV